jgi:hypothetical protein
VWVGPEAGLWPRGQRTPIVLLFLGLPPFTLRSGKVARLGRYMSDREQAFKDAGLAPDFGPSAP